MDVFLRNESTELLPFFPGIHLGSSRRHSTLPAHQRLHLRYPIRLLTVATSRQNQVKNKRQQKVGAGEAADLAGADGPSTLLARAKGGSLVFDEVGDYDDETQGRIVRMLDALPDPAPRIMATTQVDLSALMEAGKFRQDLFYRLGGVTLAVPALRERVEDIPLLADHFLTRAERDGLGTRRFSPEALALVRAYAWPGNVRQLENTVRRLVVTSSEEEITRAEVEFVLGNQPAVEPLRSGGEGEKLSASIARHLRRYFDLHGGNLPPPGLYDRILHEMEAPLIEIALDATGGNQARCADLLGINRNTLRKKITDLDIQVTRRRKLM